jgi:hypothetical protein
MPTCNLLEPCIMFGYNNKGKEDFLYVCYKY